MVTASKGPTTEFSLPSDREIRMTRSFDAPRRLIFEAYTNPSHVPHWMIGPPGWSMPVCEIDLRPGGKWHFVWRKADGSEMAMQGEYREIVPPERVVWTESWGGPWPETVNTLVLTEEDGRTTLRCTMLYPTKQARDAAFASGMKDGAAQSFDRLAELLHTLR